MSVEMEADSGYVLFDYHFEFEADRNKDRRYRTINFNLNIMANEQFLLGQAYSMIL